MTRRPTEMRGIAFEKFKRANPFLRRLSTLSLSIMSPTRTPRGALIVFEGCDKSGKTTQSKKLVNALTADGHSCLLIRFPDRTTPIGRLIDEYLQNKSDVDDHAIHHLFSANRWEQELTIRKKLEEGVTVFVDRYAYSGVAFSAAKQGMDLEWCKQPDVGLPLPDLVLFLDIKPEQAATRPGFGEECYETLKFQNKVYSNYMQLKDKNWKIVKADRDIEEVQDELARLARNAINSVRSPKIGKLWKEI